MAEPSTVTRTGARQGQEPIPGNGYRQDYEYGRAVSDITQNGHWMAVGRLTPGLIHEINNAFCVIGNYVQLLMLEQERRGWDIVKPLTAMNTSLERVQALTHRVAGYVRRPACPQSRLRINELLEETLALASLQKTFRELQIRKAFADNLPEIEGDPGSLMDAFLELLVYAAHTLGRGGALTISIEPISDWVAVRLSGSAQWQQCPDGTLTLTRQVVERQGGRVVHEAQSGTTEERLSIWLRPWERPET